MFLLVVLLALPHILVCENHFNTEFEWSVVNYTWQTSHDYLNAIESGQYIPGNSPVSGFRFYQNRIYLTVPKYQSQGVPVTLAYINADSKTKLNPLLTPFPSWEHNVGKGCNTLQSVQAIEIDSKGIMWIIDGERSTGNIKCPGKLVLVDLNLNGKVIHSYNFPENILSVNGGDLNDIVVDEDEKGDYAYITESSDKDPGLIVYSRSENKAWKFRDESMHAEPVAANFTVAGNVIPMLGNINGIALSPKSTKPFRTLYYSALTAFNLYAINTDVLKNEKLSNTNNTVFRRSLKLIGQKLSQGDGLTMDINDNLYMTLLPIAGVAKWNINSNFNSSKILDQNRNKIGWTDVLAWDNTGYLYLMAGEIYQFMIKGYDLTPSSKIMFRLMKLCTMSY